MVRELDLKIVWKKDTNLSQGPPPPGSLPCWPPLGTSPSAFFFYIWGPGTQGWGLRTDGLAHIWRDPDDLDLAATRIQTFSYNIWGSPDNRAPLLPIRC